CAGPSLLATSNVAGDVVFVGKFSPRKGEVERGDVVIANMPQNAQQMACKRVIARDGETILVYSTSCFGGRRESVPQGHVWLEGDNASNSTDSRTYGPVPLAMVKGRVVLKVRRQDGKGYFSATHGLPWPEESLSGPFLEVCC
ncbi:unnamed protein product, partial [Sphacelaria rigidula]